MISTLVIDVPGQPVPAGSKVMLPVGGGRKVIVDQNRASGRGQAWRKAIQEAAMIAIGDNVDFAPVEGPVRIRCLFIRQRPQRHYYGNNRERGKLKTGPDVEPHPLMAPDLTKLVRGLEDALNGVIWKDDSQIIAQLVAKQWGDKYHTQIVVEWESGVAV